MSRDQVLPFLLGVGAVVAIIAAADLVLFLEVRGATR